MRYGYLPQSNAELGKSISKRTYHEAIKELQSFAHINVTGELDAETEKVCVKFLFNRLTLSHRWVHNI